MHTHCPCHLTPVLPHTTVVGSVIKHIRKQTNAPTSLGILLEKRKELNIRNRERKWSCRIQQLEGSKNGDLERNPEARKMPMLEMTARKGEKERIWRGTEPKSRGTSLYGAEANDADRNHN